MARPRTPAHVDLWPDRALVVAQLGRVRWHRHAAAALLVGLDGAFHLRWADSWRRTHAAWMPAGVAHELACHDTLMTTLYMFPLTGDAQVLAAGLGVDPQRPSLDLTLPPSLVSTLVAVHGGDVARATTRARLQAELFSGPRLARAPDPRVLRAAALVREHASDGLSLVELADTVGLSPTRLMHLFKAGAGVPVRRYRVWERMRLLTQHVAAGETLTQAGLAAGFADSQHLSHGFRDMFGTSASRILNGRSRLRA
ncbi:helix-turn-helix domain-containing protein [Enhygromyxa salina]|uniref:Bifunctional transcriptional activator/DNA repair enzyme Ada n=1 Tax=Enhygromyxa salina TaxID=215803 RepID=A0A2S9YII6_9BACT|nr:AraC family transcriptional regulator [Enhygromyxa salina]PRQ04918.1 Bifunctional transcriptional activator/DNA repair enzyme Ada [Enhygromyxa salina]